MVKAPKLAFVRKEGVKYAQSGCALYVIRSRRPVVGAPEGVCSLASGGTEGTD